MRLGAHVSGGVKGGLDRGVELGCDAVQVFSQSPRMWRPTAFAEEDLARVAERRAELGVPVLIHALYLVNLASPDDALVERSVTALRASCQVASAIGAEAVIVHVGSHLGAGFEAGLERVEPALRAVLDELGDDVWLLLENTAGTGGTIGRTLDELARIQQRCDHPRLGLCLDSCHLYATGIDVGDREAMDRLVAEVDGTVGLRRLRALHVNDSETPLGSNRDRHANVGEGQIGDGLAVFLGHPRLQDLPAVLETAGHDGKGPDERCLQTLRDLHRRGVALYS